MAEQPTFQWGGGGSKPTSPLQLRFEECAPSVAAEAYRRWHYLGSQGFLSTFNFGAYYNGELEGAISYGAPNATDLDGHWDRTTQQHWWEIKRLVMSPNCPKNSESRFIAITIRMLKKRALVRGIVTYADDGQGHSGTIYKASGFTSLGMTAPKKDFWVNGKIQQRGKTRGVCGEWRERSRKWLFVKHVDQSIKVNHASKPAAEQLVFIP